MFKVKNIGQFEIQNLGGRWLKPGETVVFKTTDVDPRRLAALKDAKCVFIEVLPEPEVTVKPANIPTPAPKEDPIIIVNPAPGVAEAVVSVEDTSEATAPKRRGRPKKTDTPEEG